MNNLYIDLEKGPILGNNIKQKSLDINLLLNDLDNLLNKIDDLSICNENIDALKQEIVLMKQYNVFIDASSNYLINVSKAYERSSKNFIIGDINNE